AAAGTTRPLGPWMAYITTPCGCFVCGNSTLKVEMWTENVLSSYSCACSSELMKRVNMTVADRVVTEQPPWTPSDPLGEALHRLRMRGTFYCRAEVSEPWALEMPAITDSVSFHVITEGACWLQVPHAEPLEL